MFRSTRYVLALSAAMLAGAPALAADMTPKANAEQTSADHDFGKLSKDGMKAFKDVRMARLAIFDGQTSKARTEIDNADTALKTAKTDDTVFTKAEAELKTPAGMAKPASPAASTTPVEWLPVDGAMTLGEDYTASPDKMAGVTKANGQLAKGDHKGAMETLKLADVDVNFVVELAPLQATLTGVENARQLIDNGHYYEANQALKAVEDGARFDEQAFVATPNHAGGKMGKSGSAG